MAVRIVARLFLFFVSLTVAAVLAMGGLTLLASSAIDMALLQERDQVATLERAVEDGARKLPDATPAPPVVLVIARILLMAALPPVHRIHVYHRSD